MEIRYSIMVSNQQVFSDYRKIKVQEVWSEVLVGLITTLRLQYGTWATIKFEIRTPQPSSAPLKD